MTELYKNLKVAKLSNYPIMTEIGLVKLSGFALYDTEKGELVRMGRNRPYLPAGGESACRTIVESGLLGSPEHYPSTKTQATFFQVL